MLVLLTSQRAFVKAKSLCSAFLKATKYTKDFTNHYYYLAHFFMQDLLETSVVQMNTILSVVCSFLLLLVIIYPWLPNIYNVISISYY